MNKLKRFLAILLVVFMMTAVLPVETFAAAAAQDILQTEGLITSVPEGMTVTSLNAYAAPPVRLDRAPWCTLTGKMVHGDRGVVHGPGPHWVTR